MGASLYATKQVNLGWSTSFGTFERIARVPIWIGKTAATASSIASYISTISAQSPNMSAFYQLLNPYLPYDYSGFPNIIPGKYYDPNDWPQSFAKMRLFNQYSVDISYTYPQGDGALCLVDDDGNGLYFGGREVNPVYSLHGAYYDPQHGALGFTNYGGGYRLPPGISLTGYDATRGWLHTYGIFLDGDDNLAVWNHGWISDDSRLLDASVELIYNPNVQYNVSDLIKAWIDGLPDVVEPDPYEDGVGPSGPGGGDGTFDFSSTAIAPPGVPSIGAMDTGMINIYVPSASDLRGLAHYLWAGAFDPESFKRVFLDPMDAIIGLHIVPVTATQIGTTAATLMVGNISSGLSMPKANSQYVQIDFGTVNILPKWGAYLDFSPYSKLQLFLPYIGYVDISPDDCMNGSINVKYTIDILGGTCVAHVTCTDGTTPGGHMLYEFSASCACEVPVTSGQYQNIAFSVLNVGTSIARAVMGGFVQNATHAVSSIAESVQNAIKPEITRSGGFGASAGLMGGQIPYLILTIPRMCIPGQQNTYIGYPSFVTKTMGDLIGYASINVTHLENMSCTDEEANEIIALLKQGVIW